MDLQTQPSTTTGARRQAALAALIEAIRQLEGLTEQVGPFALPSDTCDRAPALVAALCRELDVALTFDAPAGGREQDFAVTALAVELRRAQGSPDLAGPHPGDVARLVTEARRHYDEEDAGYRQ